MLRTQVVELQIKLFGRANAFFIVLPYWGDFYDDNDVRRDVNFVDYVYRWVKKIKLR